MDNTGASDKWQTDLWVSLYDEDSTPAQCTSFTTEQIIESIRVDTLDEFNRKFASITCDKFAHPLILHTLVCKILECTQDKVPQSDDTSRKFLTNIFVTAVDKSSLETLEQFLELRLSFSSTGIKHKDSHRVYKSEHFILLLNQLTTDERSEVYQNFLLHLMRWAALCPVQVVTFLINTALTRPSLIPPICQILTKQLRSIVLFKCNSLSTSPLITSLLNFSLFYSLPHESSGEVTLCQSKYYGCFVHFIKEFYKARYLRNQSCVISIESIVIEWITIGNIVPSSVSTQIDILNQLIEGNLGGKLQWCHINLVQLLLYFVTCIISLRRKANIKELFLSTIDCIMKRHIQRNITMDEVDQIFNRVKPEDTIVLIYFDKYCHHFYIRSKLCRLYPRLSQYQLVMMACVGEQMTFSLQQVTQQSSHQVAQSIERMFTFMTKSEIHNLLHCLSFHLSIVASVHLLLSALHSLLKGEESAMEKTIDATYLISSVDLAIRSCLSSRNITVRREEKVTQINDINGNTVHRDTLSGKVHARKGCTGDPLDQSQGDSLMEIDHLHENECKLMISREVKKLLEVVPVDCRAIVLQLENDLSAL